MKTTLVSRLVCPACKSPLDLEITSRVGEEVVDGKLLCGGCRQEYPVRGGIPRFVKSDSYASSFSFEWKRWQRTQFDTPSRKLSAETFVSSTGRNPEELAGKLVLEAGCGAGRYLDVLTRAGAEVIGVDLSEAAEVSYKNVGGQPNCHVIQADVMNLPFAARTFDFAYSIGVLHITPDTRKSFLKLAEVLKSQGEVAIWVYPLHRLADALDYFPGRANEILGIDARYHIPKGWEKVARLVAPAVDWTTETSTDLQRVITRRLPVRWLYAGCHVAIPLYHLLRIPLFYPLRLVTKISMAPEPEWRVLDTFDWYSTRYCWKHTFAEMEGWFREAGCTEIQACPRLVAMRGKLAA